MYPTIETIREIAAKGQYKRVPVCREVYADRYTPVEVMRTLRKASRHCYLLESASQTEVWGRYSFLGYEPAMEITCTDGAMKIRRTEGEDQGEITKQVAHPGDTLREILKEYYDEKGEPGFEYAYRYPGMNKVLQAAGRVIRTKEDIGVILLMDERFMNREYRTLFPREWSSVKTCTIGTVETSLKDFWEQVSEMESCGNEGPGTAQEDGMNA